MLCGIFRSLPEPGTLDVYAYEIDIGVIQGKAYGVVSLAATEFHNYGIVISEEIPCPTPLETVVLNGSTSGFPIQQFVRRWLHQTGKGLVFPEFTKFVLSHQSLFSCLRPCLSPF